MSQETQTGALYQPRGMGWGGRWEGGSKGRGYMYTYGLFMLRFDRKQQNSIKQLLSIKNKLKKKKGSANLIVNPCTTWRHTTINTEDHSWILLKETASLWSVVHLNRTRGLLSPVSQCRRQLHPVCWQRCCGRKAPPYFKLPNNEVGGPTPPISNWTAS